MLTSSPVYAACEEKQAFDKVRAHTNVSFDTGSPLTETQRRGVDAELKKLNLLTIYPALSEYDQTIHAQFLNRLMVELMAFQRSGQRNMNVLTDKNMRKAGQIFDELCKVEQSAIGIEQTVTPRLIFERLKFNFTNDYRGGNARDVRSFVNLSLVFFFLLGLISMIVFCWKAYVLAFPFVMNRKSCEIQTKLKVLDVAIEGAITILGTRGSRFIPSGLATV